MDPISLAGLAISAAPTIARWLGAADATQDTISAVARAAKEVLGTDDPEAARDAMALNPEAATAFKIRMAEIAAERDAAERNAMLEEMRLHMADTANAREQTKALAATGSWLAYGALIVSVVVLSLFGFALVGTAYGLLINEGMVRLLEYSMIAVLGYWVGSSAGSAAKDRRLSG